MSKRKARGVLEAAAIKQVSDEKLLEIQNQFCAAVDENDVDKVAFALFSHSDILGATDLDMQNIVAENETNNVAGVLAPYLSRATTLLENWKNALDVGDSIDMYRKQELKWYQAKIIKKEGVVFSLHYNGWGSKYDDHGLFFADCKMYPCGTAVKKKKSAPKKEKAVHYEFLEVSAVPEAAEIVEVDRASRRARAARVVDVPEREAPVKRQKTKAEEDYEDALRREWVCSVCYQLEAPDESDLILCDGLCRRSFHLMCLNLSEEEGAKLLADDGEWWCEECLAGRHTCFVCGDEGEDHEDVIMCSQDNCGKFYHYRCLTLQQAPYNLKKKVKLVPSLASATSSSSANASSSASSPCKREKKAPARFRDDSDEGLPTPTAATPQKDRKEVGFAQYELKCPNHFCDTCHNLYGSDKPQYGHNSHDSVHKCFRCPRAFHFKCIPPSSRVNPHVMLCPNHPNEVLPTFEPLDAKEAEALARGKKGLSGMFNNLWDQMQLPLCQPCEDKIADFGHFRLPADLQTEINSHPPTFKLIWSNDYDTLSKTSEEEDYPEGVSVPKVHVPLHISDEMCECSEKCDENCLNRISKIECFEKANKKDSICNVGKDCGNRHFTNREYVKVQPFQEYGMGWGLKAKEDVSAGTLVIEYIGEIITDVQMSRRMTMQAELTPHDHDFYIMELSNGLFVDGKRKGNLSRFINHACDPNCELVRWVVKGRTRIGIFALKDIREDEPLSYDYQFDTQEADTFRCGCGSAKCRGTMAPKKKIVSKESLSKKDVKRMIAAGKKRENKESLTEEAWKKSYTGKNLPGDSILEMRNGPPKNSFGLARELKLFLPRNISHASNIADRRKRMWVKAEGKVFERASTANGNSSR